MSEHRDRLGMQACDARASAASTLLKRASFVLKLSGLLLGEDARLERLHLALARAFPHVRHVQLYARAVRRHLRRGSGNGTRQECGQDRGSGSDRGTSSRVRARGARGDGRAGGGADLSRSYHRSTPRGSGLETIGDPERRVGAGVRPRRRAHDTALVRLMSETEDARLNE